MDNCNGQWLTCACKLLKRNGVDEHYFGQSVHKLLQKNRAKYRKIMIVGVAICDKTFFTEPTII